MTHIKRRALLTLSLFALTGAGLVGCGGGSNGAATPDAAPTFDNGKIVYLNESLSNSAANSPFGRVIIVIQPGVAARAIVRTDAPSALNSAPTLSPDGNLIAFVSQNGANRDIYTVKTDGSGLKRLTDYNLPTVKSDNQLTWSSDSKRIAYLTVGVGTPEATDIAQVSVDGGTPTILIGGLQSAVADIAYSPNNRDFAYISADRANPGNNEIYLQTFGEVGNPRVITGSQPSELSLAFSPDGKFLAFSSVGTGGTPFSIIEIDGRGGNPVPIGNDTARDITWSPDGQTLAYSNGSRIKLVRADGKGGVRPLDLKDTTGRQIAPSWSR